LAADAGEQLSLIAAGIVYRPDEVNIPDLTSAVLEELDRRNQVAAKLVSSKAIINAERVRALTAALEH
jgi:hypothetical protein